MHWRKDGEKEADDNGIFSVQLFNSSASIASLAINKDRCAIFQDRIVWAQLQGTWLFVHETNTNTHKHTNTHTSAAHLGAIRLLLSFPLPLLSCSYIAMQKTPCFAGFLSFLSNRDVQPHIHSSRKIPHSRADVAHVPCLHICFVKTSEPAYMHVIELYESCCPPTLSHSLVENGITKTIIEILMRSTNANERRFQMRIGIWMSNDDERIVPL